MASVNIKGGEALRKRIQEMVKKVGQGGSVSVGFLEGATYPDGTPVAKIAADNEYGDPENRQPPRPFFRSMIEEKKGGWGPSLGRIAKSTDYDIDETLGRMGEGIRGQLQTSILELQEPPLAEYTVRKKGFSKPLIDTGHMLQSVDYEVET